MAAFRSSSSSSSSSLPDGEQSLSSSSHTASSHRLSLTPAARKSSFPSLSRLSTLSQRLHSSPATPGPSVDALLESSSSPGSSKLSASSSAFMPYFRRFDIGDEMSTRGQKKALLTLELSTLSFLNAVVTDNVSDKPIYTVETVGSSTSIWRSDPWEGYTKAGALHWPKDAYPNGKGKANLPAALIQIKGHRLRSADGFLKYSTLTSAYKFNVPSYSHSLKWKRMGSSYQCTTASVRGPVAMLEPAMDRTPSRLKIFETLQDKYDSRPSLDHAGIPVSLLDHLFVSALLLVTQPEEWITIAHHRPSIDTSMDPLTTPTIPPATPTSTSARQRRKIMYGEPLYRSLRGLSIQQSDMLNMDDILRDDLTDELDMSEPASEPVSPQLRPEISRRESQMSHVSSLVPDDSTVVDVRRPGIAWDQASLSSDSIVSPPTPRSEHSRGSIKASFLDPLDSDNHVPRIDTNAPYNFGNYSLSAGPLSSESSPSPSSQYPSYTPVPPTPSTSSSRSRRELPTPPMPPPSQTQGSCVHRSRSTPSIAVPVPYICTRRPVTQESMVSEPANVCDRAGEDNFPHRPQSAMSSRQSPLSPSHSSRRRRLPRIPNTAPHPPLPQVVSQPNFLQPQMMSPGEKRMSQILSRTLPPTPVTPAGPSVSRGPFHEYSVPMTHTFTHTLSPDYHVQPASVSSQTSPACGALEVARQKEVGEFGVWMRTIASPSFGRTGDRCEEAVYDIPPPAYHAIDFSRPLDRSNPPR